MVPVQSPHRCISSPASIAEGEPTAPPSAVPCCTRPKQHQYLLRHCLQAKNTTPPRCFLTLKVTTTCNNGHARGDPQNNLWLALSLHHTPQSQPMHLQVRVSGQAYIYLGCCCSRICICQGSGRARGQAARHTRLEAG